MADGVSVNSSLTMEPPWVGWGWSNDITRWCETEARGLLDYKKRNRNAALTSYNPQPRR